MQHAGELLPENSLYMPHAGMFLLKNSLACFMPASL
jgi:hypothetical protein